MFGYDDENHRRMSKAIADRPAPSGLEKAMLEAGDIVTFSRNKVTGDRSYINGVWEVVAVNRVMAKLKNVGGARSWNDEPIMLMMDEYEFYDGRMFIDGERS